MNTVAIIQARMGSTRLPGKVMKNLFGKTVLQHVVERVIRASNIDQVVVATTQAEKDNLIVEEAEKLGVAWFRGNEDDVLDRYYQAAVLNQADIVVRVTSDCPLIDSEVLSDLVGFYKEHKYDYVSNTLKRSYPRGLDAEVLSFESLKVAHENASNQESREHVTPYVYNNPDLFSLYSYENAIDYSEYRWTLDTAEDWDLIQKIYENLYRENEIFSWEKGIALMQQKPELYEINAGVEQKKLSNSEGLQ
ncbi:acylneuraminate cytidylyltransferase [Saccharibacillus sp. O16]|nr:acylneuraminate cytidylyltransferase [Saccharibacillus sp. O16]